MSETNGEPVKCVKSEDGALWSLTLARPERRNAITVAMYAALADAFEAAAKDEAVRVIRLAGEGVDFTAGNDLHDFMTERPTIDENLPVYRLLRALAHNMVPIVAAVQGNAVGIGTTMLMHCDLVVAEETARFRMPFVDLGLVPEAASSLLFPMLAGRRAAARTMLLTEPFSAADALSYGLASHVVPAGQAGAKADAIAEALLAKPAEALRLTQKLLRTSSDKEAVLARMNEENGHFAARLSSPEVAQAIMAFFAKKGG